jgi:hypothetical protein
MPNRPVHDGLLAQKNENGAVSLQTAFFAVCRSGMPKRTFHMSSPINIGGLRRLLMLLALIGTPAHADTFIVGTGTGCTHSTIQAAVNAAAANGGSNTVRITRSLTYTAQALTITTSQELTLIGGFATCAQNTADGLRTTVSGAGGATEPVMRINGALGSIVNLRNLDINDGDEDGSGNGGGICYIGNGLLEINESVIGRNSASNGGGIYAQGTGTAAQLIIGTNVVISSNTARSNGGGIFVNSMRMTMTAPGSIILNNTAAGYGGGLAISGVNFSAYADIGSAGAGNLGAVNGNVANNGGGIAVVAGNATTESKVRLFSADAAQPLRIKGNSASNAGGGVYLKPKISTTTSSVSEVQAWQTYIEDNVAKDAPAIYLDYESGSRTSGTKFSLNPTGISAPAGAAPCPVGIPCGRIAGNQALNGSGQPTDGSVIYGNSYSDLQLNRVAIEGNRGHRVILLTGDESKQASLKDVLITSNALTDQVIFMNGGSPTKLTIEDTTIAGNDIAATLVLSSGTAFIYRSILWQPGKTLLAQSGTGGFVNHVIGSEIVSLGGGPWALRAPPRFVDPERGDYSLRAGSRAVDFTGAIAGDDYDMNGMLRDKDLPFLANLYGPRDIGALERQELLPLVLNQDFNADLNLWPLVTPGSVTWDSSQNGSGPTGSGSAYVRVLGTTQFRVVAASQCINLPGPAQYLLNGWGRSIGSNAFYRDTVLLHWEFRSNGGDACNAGSPTSEGDHILTRLDTWTQPAIPASIDVPAAQFTNNSSITVSLVVVDNSIQVPHDVVGWFDGITLEPRGDAIFRNGFD